ncbi:hypothetical protein [Rugamonas aquatica]|uniref:Uncharacterized protein n=1 Tax=Rugamonas aquatica TaxID=2743357 RepID=A0A6A7N2D9_9BURK|nr:hypothetical protein [Rugamonas aquatica]MQA39008.1 hypothetical protein [Rugamonas aquatica]
MSDAGYWEMGNFDPAAKIPIIAMTVTTSVIMAKSLINVFAVGLLASSNIRVTIYIPIMMLSAGIIELLVRQGRADSPDDYRKIDNWKSIQLY